MAAIPLQFVLKTFDWQSPELKAKRRSPGNEKYWKQLSTDFHLAKP
jgi:hypothetical protein